MNHPTNRPPEPNDPLDTLLREADEYIPDNGFTARVMTQLPPPRRRLSRRAFLISAAILGGSALAVWLMPGFSSEFAALLQNWSAWNWNTLLTSIPLLAVLGSLGWGLWALVKGEN